MRKAIIIGATIAAAATIIADLLYWFICDLNLPAWAGYLIGGPAIVLNFLGSIIAQDWIHGSHAHTGCRLLHVVWILQWSMGLNVAIGALIGLGVSWARKRQRSRTRPSNATSEPAPGAGSSAVQG